MSSDRQQLVRHAESDARPLSRRGWLTTAVGALLGSALWLGTLAKRQPRSQVSTKRASEHNDSTQRWLGHN